MSDEEARPLRPVGALAWGLGAASVLMLVAGLAVSIDGSVASDIVQLALIEALVFVLACFAVLRVHQPDRELRQALGLRATDPLLGVLGIALGLGLPAPSGWIQGVIERRYPTPEAELLRMNELLGGGSVWRVATVMLAAACIGPLVEELLFRGALFGALRRSCSAGTTIVVVSLGFVVTHLGVIGDDPGSLLRGWVPLLPAAFVLTWLRSASGSLLPSLGLHVAFNAYGVAAPLLGQDGTSTPSARWVLGGTGFCLALLALVAMMERRSERAALARAEDAP